VTTRATQFRSAGLAKPKRSPEAVLRKMNDSLHHHACLGCGFRYSCACPEAARNARCQACRDQNKRARPCWDQSTDPAECCFGNCEQVLDTDAIERYRLAGPGPWFQCKTCKRAHGRLPRRGT